jgi:glycosyltransferase involved in cell wall biosynthesis
VISFPVEGEPRISADVDGAGFAILIPIFRAIGVMDLPLAHLRHVIESGRCDVDVFLLDDGSGDHSLEAASEILRCPRIRLTLLKHSSNRGECAAINTLCSAAVARGHEWGLLLHQDDWLARDWFEACSLHVREAHNEIAAIRPTYKAVRASPEDVSSLALAWASLDGRSEAISRYEGPSSIARWTAKRRWPFVGALLNLHWIQAVGGWVEGLPFAADVDFGCRLLEAGGTIEDHETVGILKVEHARATSVMLDGSPVRIYCIVAVVDRHPDLAAGRPILFVALHHAASFALRAAKSLVRGRCLLEVRSAAVSAVAFFLCVPYLALRQPFLAPPKLKALRRCVFLSRSPHSP